MSDPQRRLRTLLMPGILGAAVLVVILLLFLGSLTGRLSFSDAVESMNQDWAVAVASIPWLRVFLSGGIHSAHGSPGAADLIILSVLFLSSLLASIGVSAALRLVESSAPSVERPAGWPWVIRLDKASAAFTMAALCASLLEASDTWKRLSPHQNPFQDQGAPVWVWWILLSISFAIWYRPARRSPAQSDSRRLIRRTSAAALAGLAVLLGSTLLQLAMPEPVQGRYYGIPGFVVGRQFANEYGTYYGSAGGAAGAILGLLALMLVLRRIRNLRLGIRD